MAYAAVVRQAPAPTPLPLAHAGQSCIPQVAHLAGQVPARALYKHLAQVLHARTTVLTVGLSIGDISSAVCDCAIAHDQMVRSVAAALHALADATHTIWLCLPQACAAERAPEDATKHGHQQAKAELLLACNLARCSATADMLARPRSRPRGWSAPSARRSRWSCTSQAPATKSSRLQPSRLSSRDSI